MDILKCENIDFIYIIGVYPCDICRINGFYVKLCSLAINCVQIYGLLQNNDEIINECKTVIEVYEMSLIFSIHNYTHSNRVSN